MFFIEDKSFLTDEQKNFIENQILGFTNLAYFFQPSGANNDNCPSLSHFAIRSPSERADKNEYYNSQHAIDLEKIVIHFCEKNKIKLNKILRIAINLTYNNGCESCSIHKDHMFPHRQLLIYLNDCDKNSKTIIYNESKEKVLKDISPEKYKGVCFEGLPHKHFYPKVGHRIVLICTFT